MGQALADAATIGLLQERSTRRGEILHEQLQGALNRRVVIEQAKGKLAERLDLDMDQALAVLLAYARDRDIRLSGLAQAFVDGPGRLPRPHQPGLTSPARPRP